MKKHSALFVIAVALTFILNACNFSSKGNWSQSDKDKFNEAMGKVDLTYIGPKKEEWLACYLEKLEANYSSFDEANKDIDGCTKLAEDCGEEVIGGDSGTKGNWSAGDKEFYYNAMEATDLSGLGESKDAFVECYFNKLQDNYPSYWEANKDEAGCTALAEECSREILGE